ncbi:hypothetical protein DPN68_13045 [Flavobacterium tibetense]|uniref:Uncharacterized protein n=1 Tax=Flavobacterium tibetense TaxID=2233533 RepID=A0A365NYH1_9FLAO|nr:hypothetical protein DPN68_13045 [Flavobacterium tibetense]
MQGVSDALIGFSVAVELDDEPVFHAGAYGELNAPNLRCVRLTIFQLGVGHEVINQTTSEPGITYIGFLIRPGRGVEEFHGLVVEFRSDV